MLIIIYKFTETLNAQNEPNFLFYDSMSEL